MKNSHKFHHIYTTDDPFTEVAGVKFPIICHSVGFPPCGGWTRVADPLKLAAIRATLDAATVPTTCTVVWMTEDMHSVYCVPGLPLVPKTV